jgi:hypothetical protein
MARKGLPRRRALGQSDLSNAGQSQGSDASDYGTGVGQSDLSDYGSAIAGAPWKRDMSSYNEDVGPSNHSWGDSGASEHDEGDSPDESASVHAARGGLIKRRYDDGGDVESDDDTSEISNINDTQPSGESDITDTEPSFPNQQTGAVDESGEQPETVAAGLPPRQQPAPDPNASLNRQVPGSTDFNLAPANPMDRIARHLDAMDPQEAKGYIDAAKGANNTEKFIRAFGGVPQEKQRAFQQFGMANADKAFGMARAAGDQGDWAEAARLLNAGHSTIIDGNDTDFHPTNDRMVVTSKNLAGDPNNPNSTQTYSVPFDRFHDWLHDPNHFSPHALMQNPGYFKEGLAAAETGTPMGAVHGDGAGGEQPNDQTSSYSGTPEPTPAELSKQVYGQGQQPAGNAPAALPQQQPQQPQQPQVPAGNAPAALPQQQPQQPQVPAGGPGLSGAPTPAAQRPQSGPGSSGMNDGSLPPLPPGYKAQGFGLNNVPYGAVYAPGYGRTWLLPEHVDRPHTTPAGEALDRPGSAEYHRYWPGAAGDTYLRDTSSNPATRAGLVPTGMRYDRHGRPIWTYGQPRQGRESAADRLQSQKDLWDYKQAHGGGRSNHGRTADEQMNVNEQRGEQGLAPEDRKWSPNKEGHWERKADQTTPAANTNQNGHQNGSIMVDKTTGQQYRVTPNGYEPVSGQ